MTGRETFIAGTTGKVTWKYPHPSRDGWVLDNGNVLLAPAESKTDPGGAAAEVDRDGKKVQIEDKMFQWPLRGLHLCDGRSPILFHRNKLTSPFAQPPRRFDLHPGV